MEFYSAGLAADAAPPAVPTKKKQPSCPPQQTLDEHWERFITKTPGKITRIFHPSLYANLLPQTFPKTLTGNISATASYEAAKEACERKVQRIVRECRRTNEKWSDPDFDIESDFGTNNCLNSLVDTSTSAPSDSVTTDELQNALTTLTSVDPALFKPVQEVSVPSLLSVFQNTRGGGGMAPPPESVHRVDWIYDAPSFTINGFGVSDVQQGGTGDCWWVAAVATLCSEAGLMERVCVARDEDCGVYGFVFQRDGEWCPVVVDDNLYLTQADYDRFAPGVYDPTGKQARRWKERWQTGSEALAFAKCAEPNETWLPLLEKAYAKVHGDYAAIEGGFAGEGVEDMTGGVTTSVDTNKVLNKDRLWQELLNPNGDFIFGTGTPGSAGGDSDARSGLAYQHAYSVLKAVEEEDEDGKKVKLVRIRNPWGRRNWVGEGEWNGPWSDGSKEWNAYWLNKLDHKFGDDGIFWMTFDDMLSRFDQLDRTRLFGEGWRVVQQWTTINVSWITGYINTKFVVEIKEGGLFVFVLSKLDDRYFRGLEGHAEVELDPGKYEVFPKILATKNDERDSVEEIVKSLADKRPQKLRQIGLNYDFAHVKAAPPPTTSKDAAGAKSKQEKEIVKIVSEEKGDVAAKPESSAEAAKKETESKPEDDTGEEPPKEKAKEEAATEAVKEEATTKGVKEEQAAPSSEESTKTDSSHENPVVAKEEKPADTKTAPAEVATKPVKTPEKAAALPDPRPPMPKPEVDEANQPEPEPQPGPSPQEAGAKAADDEEEMTIKLEAPGSAEEGSALNVDGEATGGTM
ncbi:putative calpain family cysteine protease [Diplodia seriata]|uniref:Putative calpain family cysteine protease n=1 Tax=Diplodia seriata TaxID=420778 RepID=A0A0G2H359_9PEZI|nr:putative calpain family cysteine protease [Diplodia seriata]